MKIGIITFHRAHNYGAVLQCYALQEILKGMGHEVEVIDYRQPYIEYVYKPYSVKRLLRYKRSPIGLLNYIRHDVPKKKAKTYIFDDFKSQFLNLSRQYGLEIPQDYDTYVIGSDQLWGVNCLGGALEPIYFGQFPHKKDSKIIGYAISSNIASLSTKNKYELSKLISNFDYLSVREQAVSEYLNTVASVNPEVTLDPTLLTNPSLWDSMVNPEWAKRKYILVYYVSRGFGEFAHNMIIKKANQLAGKYNCEVVDLSSMTYSVNDFISAFKYAQCVVTPSFHASVFSVIFNRPLYSIKLHDGCDVRYTNILNALGMSDYLKDMDFEDDVIPTIDYDAVNKKLSELREPSIAFLTKALSK